MSCRINLEECIACGACYAVCPTDAITGQDDDNYAIDPKKCNCCKAEHNIPQCKAVCPIEDTITCECDG